MRPNMKRWGFVVVAIVVALAFTAAHAQTLTSRTKDKRLLTVNVLVDFNTFDQVPSANGGPFYVGGTILDPDTGEELGLFHCFGFFFQGGALALVSQEFDFTGRGKIVLTGIEDEGPRAITGGTGRFRRVRGEAVGIDLSALPLFTVTFSFVKD